MRTIHNKSKKQLVTFQLLIKLFLWLIVGGTPSLVMAQEMTQSAVSGGAGVVTGGNYSGYVSAGQMATYMFANGTQISTSGIILNEISGNTEFTFQLSGSLVQNENLKSGQLQLKSALELLAGTPLAFANVYLILVETGEIYDSTQTDVNGYFEFSNVPYFDFYFTVNTPEIPAGSDPVLLSFESNIFIKEVEINGEVGAEGVSASVTVTPNNGCGPGSPDYAIWYIDKDGDGFGDAKFSVGQCTQPVGYVLNNSDCNDSDAGINPDVLTEVAGSGIDANCDGLFLWYEDADLDGLGSDVIISSTNSSPGVGEADNNSDCNDTNTNSNPGTADIAGSGIDANCDGLFLWYMDDDQDGFGSFSTISSSNSSPGIGEADNHSDCDDSNPNVNPDATDIPGSGADGNCDGLFLWYQDSDQDGYGIAVVIASANSSPGAGESDNHSDCDDSNPNVNPGATDVPGSGVDANCDGNIDCLNPDITSFAVSFEQVYLAEVFEISATYEGGDLVSAVWYWGDGTSDEGLTVGNMVNGNHIYQEAGLYDVTLVVENECGDYSERTFSYAVVVDPCAGGVQGFSFQVSPQNSFPANPNIYGYASLAFRLKYDSDKKYGDKAELKGVFSYYFHWARFWFKAETTDWLMVKDNLAIFKGRGKINRMGDYNYLVSMIDGNKADKNASDYFRLKVWSDDGTVIYDNQLGEPDSSLPTTPVFSRSLQKMKGCDDKYEKSGVIEQENNFTAEGPLSINAYPNPTQGRVNLDIKNSGDSGFTITVVNITGQKVLERPFLRQNRVELDLSGKVPGVYFVNFIQGETYITKKIILNSR